MRLRFRPEVILEIPLRDFSGIEPAARNAELKRVLEEHARTPFDLTEGPLIRSELLRLVHEQQYPGFHLTSHRMRWMVDKRFCSASWPNCTHRKYKVAPPNCHKSSRSANMRESSYCRVVLSRAVRSVPIGWIKFQHLPAPLDLPVDRPRPATVKGYSGIRFVHISVPNGMARLSSLARKRAVRLSLPFLRAFKLSCIALHNRKKLSSAYQPLASH